MTDKNDHLLLLAGQNLKQMAVYNLLKIFETESRGHLGMTRNSVLDAWGQYERNIEGISPGLCQDLRSPASSAALDALEELIGYQLPAELRELWLLHDGQLSPEERGLGLLGGLVFLSIEGVQLEWLNWRKRREETSVDEMAELSMLSVSVPEGVIRPEYTWPGWIPVGKEVLQRNYLGIDLDPGPLGTSGQLIIFGRDEDEKTLIARCLGDFLSFLALEARRGAFVVVDGTFNGVTVPLLKHREGRFLSVLQRLAEEKGPLA